MAGMTEEEYYTLWLREAATAYRAAMDSDLHPDYLDALGGIFRMAADDRRALYHWYDTAAQRQQIAADAWRRHRAAIEALRRNRRYPTQAIAEHVNAACGEWPQSYYQLKEGNERYVTAPPTLNNRAPKWAVAAMVHRDGLTAALERKIGGITTAAALGVKLVARDLTWSQAFEAAFQLEALAQPLVEFLTMRGFARTQWQTMHQAAQPVDPLASPAAEVRSLTPGARATADAPPSDSQRGVRSGPRTPAIGPGERLGSGPGTGPAGPGKGGPGKGPSPVGPGIPKKPGGPKSTASGPEKPALPPSAGAAALGETAPSTKDAKSLGSLTLRILRRIHAAKVPQADAYNQLNARAWERIIRIGRGGLTALPAGGTMRSGAIQRLKGHVLELFITRTTKFAALMADCRKVAQQLNLDPTAVRFTMDVTDVVRGETGLGGTGALSDGLVYVQKGPRKVLVIGVAEVKSGNFRLLAKERGSEYGQVERTLARLETGGITIQGETFGPGEVELLADHGRRTRWLVALPPKSASPTQLANLEKDLRAQGRRIAVALLPVTEESARKAAEQIMLELTATP